ncbi:MAG: chemotaxis protein CheC [Deltaproteobacteria bacterium]|nr:chemotaxis protein CheC [Deltaproteobacteria bacterium]
MKKLSEGDLDFLRELSTIGVGHAATALSQLIGRQVGMRVPKVSIVDLASVPDLMPLSEMGASTLKEVGNILASAYLSVLGNMLDITLIPSIPSLAHDMVGAVVDIVLSDLSEIGDTAFVFETEFYDITDDIKGHFFLLPDPESIEVIMRAIRSKNG